MPSASSGPWPSPSSSERDEPPASPARRVVRGALARAAWPLAVLGPAAVYFVAADIVDGMLPDERPEGTCHGLGFGCTTTLRETVGLYASSAATPVIMVAVGVGAAVAGGMPARRRMRAVLVMLAGQALLATFVGITVVRVANDLA